MSLNVHEQSVSCTFYLDLFTEYSIHVRSLGLLQQLSEPVHHIGFMLHERMGIAIERNGRIFMTKDFGKRFHVHAAFEGAGSKRMPQRVKASVRYF